MKKALLLILFLIAAPGGSIYSQTIDPGNTLLPVAKNTAGFPIPSPGSAETLTRPVTAPDYWLRDSSWYFNWVYSSSSWDCYEKNYLTRNPNGSVAEDLFIIHNETTMQWENYSRTVYAYYPNGNLKTMTGQVWDDLYITWNDDSYYHYNDQGRMDTSFTKYYDKASHEYLSGSRSIYQFNGSNMTTEALYQNLDTSTSAWINTTRIEYQYDGEIHLMTQISQLWDSGSWINDLKFEFSYDPSWVPTGYLGSIWDVPGSSWENYMKATYTNNTSGFPIQKLYESWDPVTLSWVKSQRVTYLYNSSNQPLEVLTETWDGPSSSWISYSRDTYTYYANGQTNEYYQYYWNPLDLTYMDAFYMKYDSVGYCLEFYSKYIDYNTWEYTQGYRTVYSYNSSHQLSEGLSQQMDVSTGTWYDTNRKLFTYDPNGNNTIELEQVYDSGSATWQNYFKIEHYYSFTSSVNDIKGLQDYCYFRNPLQPGRSIVCPDLDYGKRYCVRLYNLGGQQVCMTNLLRGDSFIIPDNLPSGMYLLQVEESGKTIAAGKVILTR
jgi:hypothetical protein